MCVAVCGVDDALWLVILLMPSEPASRQFCPTCGGPVPVGSDVCPRCGMPGASARGGPDSADTRTRSEAARRKTNADLLFLAGLVLGGPLMTFGGRFHLGLSLVLAGAFASVLRRYTGMSLGSSLMLGAAAAVAVIVAVLSHVP
jgi:hypothetical protein